MGWVVTARGHPNVTAVHPTTFMITREIAVSQRGDCMIAVGADKSLVDVPPTLKRILRSSEKVLITLRAGRLIEEVRAQGHPSLTLDHPMDIVVRKSGFVCRRTLAISADKSAVDFSREFVTALRDPATKFEMEVVRLDGSASRTSAGLEIHSP